MSNDYSFSEIIKNIISLLYTKIFFPKARLIRRPIYIRGKSRIKFEAGLTTGYNCRIETFNFNNENNIKLYIGENCKIGDHVHISAGEKVVIGDNCLMASKIYIGDNSHGTYSGESVHSIPSTAPDQRKIQTKPIIIGDNVWIGENVSILPGTIIESGSIIGANSVVNSKIPKNSIAVGSPASVKKSYNYTLKKWV